MTKKQYSNCQRRHSEEIEATMTSLWFWRNANHDLLGSPRRRMRRRYRATFRSETTNPSFNNSPWIFGAPQSGFSCTKRWIRVRVSSVIFGRPRRVAGIASANRDRSRRGASRPRCRVSPGPGRPASGTNIGGVWSRRVGPRSSVLAAAVSVSARRAVGGGRGLRGRYRFDCERRLGWRQRKRG
jgi:hypothetical protein